ncbi:MAG: heavy-metal-associated domain-containing protein [Chitinophagaceae bacterium]
MKKIIFIPLFAILALIASAQPKYSSTGGIETAYKGKYKFTAKLDEKTNTLSFETDAPVTKAILGIYTPEELAVRKGKEYTNGYLKKGQKYSYDLKKPLYKNKYAYWIKIYTSKGMLGEYFFKKIEEVKVVVTDPKPVEETEPVPADDPSHPVIKTSINCEAGKLKVIKALKELDGVFEVKINIKTGILNLHYSSDGTPFNDIVETILDNGFDVLDDGQDSGLKKSTKPSANPCKTKN